MPGGEDGVEIDVVSVAAGGDGIGRLADGRVVFCEGALPGERVMARISEHRRDFARAQLAEVLQPSAWRVEPPCPHVRRGCGGCTWQHVAPEAQARLKVGIVADALRRLAHLPDVEVRPAAATLPVPGYRTSLLLAVGPDGRPAYRRRHGHDLVTVDSCLVAHPRLAELVAGGRFPGARQVGLRVGARTGDRLASPDRAAERAVVPEGTTVDRHGAIHEQVGGRRWRISARSFFQPGPEAAEALVDAVAAAAGGDGRRGCHLVDLYAGVGLLGGCLADRWGAASLTAVESHPAASADAARNLADLDAAVCVGEVAEVCGRGLPVGGGGRPPDLVVADPARSGLGRSAAASVAGLGAPVVVLVSCDPASLARDAGLLAGAGYRLERVEVVDLFPATFHTEAVARFVAG